MHWRAELELSLIRMFVATLNVSLLSFIQELDIYRAFG